MAVDVERIWTGSRTLMYVSVAGTSQPVTLTEAELQQPAELLAQAIQDALDSVHPGYTWTCTYTRSTGGLYLYCDSGSTSFDAEVNTGWAQWWDLSTSYSGIGVIVGAAQPAQILEDVGIRWGLPIRSWTREIVGGHRPVVWSSQWRLLLRWTRQRWSQSWEWDPRRVPCVLYQGDSDEWACANRDGWIAVRPADDELSRQAIGATSRLGAWRWRAHWLNSTVGD